jgi:hypothetical protein
MKEPPPRIGGGSFIFGLDPDYGFEMVIWKKLGMEVEKFSSPA